MPVYEYKIGTTLLGMTNIESMTVPVPNPQTFFKLYAEIVTLGDGSSFGRGFPQVEWKWNLLTRAQRDQLRAYCAGTSAAVYVRTRTNDSADAYKNYLAIMHWPLEEEKYATKRMDLNILFTQMVEQT
jgi:ABC-type proline/glycine betaine transport system substrate-binding protein